VIDAGQQDDGRWEHLFFQVASQRDQSNQHHEVEILIEMLGARVRMDLGTLLCQVISSHRQSESDVVERLVNTPEIVSQVAHCFERVARQEWLDERVQGKEVGP
jgi:hypothetical protein